MYKQHSAYLGAGCGVLRGFKLPCGCLKDMCCSIMYMKGINIIIYYIALIFIYMNIICMYDIIYYI